MKYFTILSLLLFCVVGTVVAQDTGSFGLVYKFEPVPQLSAKVDDFLPTTFTTDVSQGIGVHYQASETAAVQSMLLFGTGTYTDEFGAEDVAEWETEATITTFGIEVLVPWYFHTNGDVSVFLAPTVRYSVFSYEDEFDSEGYWDTEYTISYHETNASLQFGGQANFGNFAVFSSYGIGVNFIGITVETEPSEPDQELDTDRTVTGAGLTTSQLSIGLIYFVN
jgi:hypothetical protein